VLEEQPGRVGEEEQHEPGAVLVHIVHEPEQKQVS
jgi:hypothetical protein